MQTSVINVFQEAAAVSPPLMRRLLSLALTLTPAVSWAGCLSHPTQGGPQTASFGRVEAPADAPIHSVLAEVVTAGWNSPGFKCIKPTRTGSLGIHATPSPSGDGIHATNVPGVGIRVYFHNSAYGDILLPDNFYIPWMMDGTLRNAHFRVQLIKTAEIVEGGTITPGLLARAGYDGKAQAWVDLLDARVEPQRPTCAFASRRLVFALDKVDGGTLSAAGSSHWATQQLVSTGCINATQMLMTFTAPADDTEPSLFKVVGAGAASGVAVELRSDDPDAQAIPNSASPLVLRAAKEGQAYGFRARYRTTGKPLMPGPANVSITVNVAYR